MATKHTGPETITMDNVREPQTHEGPAANREFAQKGSETKPLNVLLIEDSMDQAKLVEVLLQGSPAPIHLHHRSRLQEGVDRVAVGDIDAVLLDLGLPDASGVECYRRLSEAAPTVPVVVLTADESDETAIAVVQKGAQDYLSKRTIDADTLVRALRFAIGRSASGRNASRPAPKPAGKVIGFLGAKGGVGNTTATLNIAAALAERQHKVVAVEFGVQFSHFALQLGDPEAYGDSLAAMPASQVDQQQIESRLTRVRFGCGMLFGAKETSENGGLSPEHVTAILKSAAQLGDYVVADLASPPLPVLKAAVAQCDLLVLVLDREPTSVAAAARMRKMLHGIGVPSGKLAALIVNRSSLTVEFDLNQIVRDLDCRMMGMIPAAADRLAAASRSREPLVFSRPDDLAASSFLDFASRIEAAVPVGRSKRA